MDAQGGAGRAILPALPGTADEDGLYLDFPLMESTQKALIVKEGLLSGYE